MAKFEHQRLQGRFYKTFMDIGAYGMAAKIVVGHAMFSEDVLATDELLSSAKFTNELTKRRLSIRAREKVAKREAKRAKDYEFSSALSLGFGGEDYDKAANYSRNEAIRLRDEVAEIKARRLFPWR